VSNALPEAAVVAMDPQLFITATFVGFAIVFAIIVAVIVLVESRSERARER
jgi:hypothetical protein